MNVHTRVERDASMGWWWVEAWDDEEQRWMKDTGSRLGLETDTFARRDAAERLALRIERAIAFLAGLRLLS